MFLKYNLMKNNFHKQSSSNHNNKKLYITFETFKLALK